MSQRYGYEIWSGLAMLIVTVAVASPVLFGVADPFIGRFLWSALFVVFLLNLIMAIADLGRGVSLFGFVVSMVFSWILVLTAPGMGLLSILLVLTAAISAYLVPMKVGLSVVGLNTAVLAVNTVLLEQPPLEVALVVGFYLLIQTATLLSTHTLIREQHQRRELAQAHVDLRAASALLAVSSRSAERLRISRDLHDTIGHQLTVLALELEAAKHRSSGQSQEHVERAGTVARELLAEMRSTVSQLRAEPTDLAGALGKVVADLPGLHVELDVEPGLSLDEERTEALVRTVQEVTTNTLRHADATRLWISVGLDDQVGLDGQDGRDVVLTAQDDGRGREDAARAGAGNGLRGIAERFEMLGGRAEFGTVAGRAGSSARVGGNVGQGFRVTARVPIG